MAQGISFAAVPASRAPWVAITDGGIFDLFLDIYFGSLALGRGILCCPARRVVICWS